MLVDPRDRAVLITGGTKGIGAAAALAFARRGARVFVTHRWGSADEDELRRRFEGAGATPPVVLEADAANVEETRGVFEHICGRHGVPLAIVSNVAVAPTVTSLDDYVARNLRRSIDYGAWPLASHCLLAKEVGGAFPRYVIGVSSAGVTALHPNYDFAAASKAVLETLVRYLAHRLFPHGVRVNAVSTRFVDTDSLRSIFGAAFVPFVQSRAPDLVVSAEDVGKAICGLASGLMDGMTGQVLTVDRGASFTDCMNRLYRDALTQREK